MKIQDHILYKYNSHKFDELKLCIQDPYHHAEGDVFTHTQMVMDALLSDDDYNSMSEYSKRVLEYSVMLHDIEKPRTRKVEEKHITHRKHAKYGSETALRLLTEMGEDIEFIYDVCNLIEYHGKPFWVSNKENPVFEVIRLSFNARNDWLYIFAKADLNGRICNDHNEIMENLEYYKMYSIENNCFDKKFEFLTETDRVNYFRKENQYEYNAVPDLFDYEVRIMCGIPASGKSTYIKNNLSNYQILSTDQIREELELGFDKKSQSRLFEEVYSRMSIYCRNRQNFVLDATNIRYDLRKKIIDFLMARIDATPRITIIWIQNDLKTSLQNNKKRTRTIDEKYLRKSYYSLQKPTEMEVHELLIINKTKDWYDCDYISPPNNMDVEVMDEKGNKSIAFKRKDGWGCPITGGLIMTNYTHWKHLKDE